MNSYWAAALIARLLDGPKDTVGLPACGALAIWAVLPGLLAPDEMPHSIKLHLGDGLLSPWSLDTATQIGKNRPQPL